MNLKFIYSLIKNSKKGKIFIVRYILASALDKIVFFSTLTLVKTDFSKGVYKKYLKFRLNNLNK